MRKDVEQGGGEVRSGDKGGPLGLGLFEKNRGGSGDRVILGERTVGRESVSV